MAVATCSPVAPVAGAVGRGPVGPAVTAGGRTAAGVVFTTGSISKICGVASRTVAKWFDAGRLKGYRIPGSQDRRVPLACLVSFLRAEGMEAAAGANLNATLAAMNLPPYDYTGPAAGPVLCHGLPDADAVRFPGGEAVDEFGLAARLPHAAGVVVGSGWGEAAADRLCGRVRAARPNVRLGRVTADDTPPRAAWPGSPDVVGPAAAVAAYFGAAGVPV